MARKRHGGESRRPAISTAMIRVYLWQKIYRRASASTCGERARESNHLRLSRPAQQYRNSWIARLTADR
jgi:hypothetical protein